MGAPPPIQLANLGMADSLILMVLALVVFGPRRLPQIGRQIGKLMYEFRKASNDFKFQMEEELRVAEENDRRKQQDAERLKNAALAPPAPTVEAQADIGAVEQASVSAQPGSYPPSYPAESAQPASSAVQEMSEARLQDAPEMMHLPRVAAPIIQPPSTGVPIPAARPGVLSQTTEAQVDPAADAKIGAEPPTHKDYPSDSTETVSQHG